MAAAQSNNSFNASGISSTFIENSAVSQLIPAALIRALDASQVFLINWLSGRSSNQ
jgi:hypothetical protein